MSNNIDNRAIAVSVKIYERLLATYPAAFRREYGPAMKQLFRDQCRDAWSEARGRGLVALWLRVLPDLAKTSFVEHLSSVNQRESVFMKMFRGLRADPRLRSTFMRAFALVFIGAIVCSVLMALWLPRTYSSTVRIEVQKDTPKVSRLHPKAPDRLADPDPYFLTTQFKIIRSYSILTNVIEDLHLREKLPAQLGKRPWTLDETFAYLSKAIEVKQTRMTSLLEVTVKNPDPQVAANIANRIAWSYRNARLWQWKLPRLGGIEAYQNHMTAQAQELREKQESLDIMREKLGVSEPDPKATNSTTIDGETMELWAEREVAAKADYLEYSNILFVVNQVPRDRFGAELTDASRNFSLSEPELTKKSAKLSLAKDRFASIKAVYGVDDPQYKTALQNLEQAQQEHDAKVDAIVTEIRDRVQEDWNLIQIIEQNEAEVRTKHQQQVEAFQPYYRLKDEVENLRYIYRESQRYLNQQIAEAGQRAAAFVVVRDPARPELKPVKGGPSIFLTWLLGGTLLALVVGGAAACLAVLTRRFSHRQGAPT